MAEAFTDASQERPLTDECLQAAELSALALRPILVEHDVAELANATCRAPIERTVDDDADPDAAPDAEGDEVPGLDTVAGPLLGHCEGVHVIVHPYRQPQLLPQRRGYLNIAPSEKV